MSNPLRQLLPRPSGYVQQEDQPPKKDAKAKAACETCRARKTKCDAKRPECSACASRGTKCEYDIDPDITRYTSLKRRFQDLEKDHIELLEVFDMLRLRSEEDAFSVLQRIRTSTDMRATISFIREGDLLAQAHATVVGTQPTFHSSSSTQSGHGPKHPTLPPLRDMLADMDPGMSLDHDNRTQERPLESPEETDSPRTIQLSHRNFRSSLNRPAFKEWPATEHNSIVENLAAFLEHTALSQPSTEDTNFCLTLCAHILKDIGNYFPFIGFILHRLLKKAKERNNALMEALEIMLQEIESQHFNFIAQDEGHGRFKFDADVPLRHPGNPSSRMGLWAAYELWFTNHRGPEAGETGMVQ